MHVVFAVPECAPFVKTGGLGEVMSALPEAIAAQGHRVEVFVPFYRVVQDWFSQHSEAATPVIACASITIPFVEQNRFVQVLDGGVRNGVRVYFVACAEFFDRDGVYGPPGKNYADNALRYGLFCRAVLEASKLLGVPDVFNVHDWQGAFLPLLLSTTYVEDPMLHAAATVFTIHNGGYQGAFPAEQLRDLLLPPEVLEAKGLIVRGECNPFAAALYFSDWVTTVSPTYAEELKTAEYGEGLEAVYRSRSGTFTGILNGIDRVEWDPATDPALAEPYDAGNLGGKLACREALLRVFNAGGVAETTAVIGIVSRIAEQKGFDLIAEAMPALAEEDVLLLILGSGEPELETTFRELAARFPRALRVDFDFNETRSHQVQAGSDMTLMPSRYEPSGLSQMYSLRYGTVPVVRATGGLCDTVSASPDGDGYRFESYTAEALLEAVRQALTDFRDKAAWQERMRRGMRKNMGWEASAREYIRIFTAAMAAHRQTRQVGKAKRSDASRNTDKPEILAR